MIDFEKYMIAEEGLFSRMREKKATREREAKEARERFDQMCKEIDPKIKPFLINAQNSMYSLIKQTLGKYSNVSIEKREINSEDFIDSVGYFCTVDMREYDKDVIDKLPDLERKLEAIADACGKKCSTVINKLGKFGETTYYVDTNPDDMCGTNLSISIY